MEPKSFEILLRKKIPYWTQFLFILIGIFFLILFLLYLFMYPSDNSSGEIRVAYYILVVPEWLKEASAYSIIGLIILIPLHSVSKIRKPGLLTISNDKVTITDKKEIILPMGTIRKIVLNDVKDFFRREKLITEVVIKQTGSRNTSFLLKYYEETEELMEVLIQFENIEFVFYNDMAIETHDED